jgi:hypothetical protein
MAALADSDIAGYVLQAGWSGGDASTAVAVALAESGGDPARRGTVDPNDLGLFQVNSHYHPEILRSNWQDPASNAIVAHAIWAKDGWAPWTTYRTGAYLLFKARGDAAVKGATLPIGPELKRLHTGEPSLAAPPGVLPKLSNPLESIGDALNRTGRFLTNPDSYVRIIQVVLGGVLLVAAVSIVARPVAEPAVKTLAKAGAIGA